MKQMWKIIWITSLAIALALAVAPTAVAGQERGSRGTRTKHWNEPTGASTSLEASCMDFLSVSARTGDFTGVPEPCSDMVLDFEDYLGSGSDAQFAATAAILAGELVNMFRAPRKSPQQRHREWVREQDRRRRNAGVVGGKFRVLSDRLERARAAKSAEARRAGVLRAPRADTARARFNAAVDRELAATRKVAAARRAAARERADISARADAFRARAEVARNRAAASRESMREIESTRVTTTPVGSGDGDARPSARVGQREQSPDRSAPAPPAGVAIERRDHRGQSSARDSGGRFVRDAGDGRDVEARTMGEEVRPGQPEYSDEMAALNVRMRRILRDGHRRVVASVREIAEDIVRQEPGWKVFSSDYDRDGVVYRVGDDGELIENRSFGRGYTFLEAAEIIKGDAWRFKRGSLRDDTYEIMKVLRNPDWSLSPADGKAYRLSNGVPSGPGYAPRDAAEMIVKEDGGLAAHQKLEYGRERREKLAEERAWIERLRELRRQLEADGASEGSGF